MLSAAGRTLCITVPPQECLGLFLRKHPPLMPQAAKEAREHVPDGQNTLKKCSSAGLAVFFYYLTVTKTKGLSLSNFFYTTLSFSRLLSVHLSMTPHQATQQAQQYLFLFSTWSFLLFLLCFLQIKTVIQGGISI